MEPLVLREARGPLRVLVIEDDPALGRLIQLVLGQHTREVTVVRSGLAALDAVRAQSFDAIASDISLPDMSGLDVIAQARTIAPAAGIVAITGFVDVDVSGGDRGRVLLGVGPRAEAVLEVDAEVLDRLAFELAADALVHGLRQPAVGIGGGHARPGSGDQRGRRTGGGSADPRQRSGLDVATQLRDEAEAHAQWRLPGRLVLAGRAVT